MEGWNRDVPEGHHPLPHFKKNRPRQTMQKMEMRPKPFKRPKL